MTRFARAKGSKASNEKAPEDSTPWEVMKEQLLQAKKEKEDSKNRQEAEQQRIQNYENFLKEQKVQKRKATWCDFPEVQKDNSQTINKFKNKKKKKKSLPDVAETERIKTASYVKNEDVDAPPKKKKKKSKSKNETSNLQDENRNETTSVSNEDVKSTQKKKKNKNKSNDSNSQQQEITSNNTDVINEDVKSPQMKKKKKNKNKSNDSNSQQQETSSNNTDAIQIPNNEKNPALEKSFTSHDANIHQSTNEGNHNFKNNNNNSLKKKKEKLVNGMPQRRKDINDKSFQLIINGKEVELVRVDGFPVMKKDAERLNELKQNMIQKGIPKSEIQRTMKLERRRAEKALARVRKEVCYNCRKGGHNLSDCPDLKSKIPGAEVGEGICFKCGSTEHRQFECKVQRDKEFRFATCFICKEPGHIARQCPDNPKGLYPNGGCCKLCGDVTHLRKDCPTASDKKEEKSIKLSTLDSTDDVEGISQEPKKGDSNEPAKKVKKIKF